MAFLYAAAWQDYKAGTVGLQLLLTSASISVTLSIFNAGINGIEYDATRIRLLSTLFVFTLLAGLALMKKLGGADVIIFTQITFLFGLLAFCGVIAIASVTGLFWSITKWLRDNKRGRHDNATLSDFRKQEMRFIPFIALAAQIILFVGYPTFI